MDRKKILLRLDPVVHDALARWASDELRSTNSQIEFLLRQAVQQRRGGSAESAKRQRDTPRKSK